MDLSQNQQQMAVIADPKDFDQRSGSHRGFQLGQSAQGQLGNMRHAIQHNRHLALERVHHHSAVKVKAPAEASVIS